MFFNGDGTLNMGELGADAVGFFIEDAALGLVLANAQTPQTNTLNNAHQTKKFTALKATAASAGLVGFEDAGFVFTVRDIVVEVNSGSPWSGSRHDRLGRLLPRRAATRSRRATPKTRCCSTSAAPRWSGSRPRMWCWRSVTTCSFSGAFSFRMGEVETVDVVQGGLLGDIVDLQVKTIKIGAEGVSVFLGDGLADYDIDADIADYLSTDTPVQVLTGQTVGNLVDGKVYRRVGPALSGSPDLTPGLGQDYANGSLWRPVAATYLAGESPATVAAGKTVAVWDATLASYRVFERQGSVFSPGGALSASAADYTGAGWLELSVFFNGDGTLNMGELGADAVGFFIEDAALGLVLGERADTADQHAQQRAPGQEVHGVEGDGGLGGAGRVRGRRLRVHGPRHRGRGQLGQPRGRGRAHDRLGRLLPRGRLPGRDRRPPKPGAARFPRHPAGRARGRACGVGDR